MKKKTYSWSALLLMCLLVFGVTLSSCDEGEDLDTNQIKAGDIALNVFGPSPAMRGGELRFIGTNLDKVTSIDLPGAEGITEITKVGAYEIRIIIPQTAQPGMIVLNTPEGKITTKTPIGFSEPISISGMTPLAIKAGAVLSIEGDYLNTVEEVIFADGIHVLKADFESQTRAKIEVKVPITAQSGKVIVSDGADLLSDGEEIPAWVYSEEELAVTLPSFAEYSPETPKAGNTMSISGADLDLVASVRFVDAEVVEFEVAEDAKSLTLKVPKEAKDGAASLVAYSGLEVALGDLAFVKPSAVIEEMKEAYGVGEELVLSGSDLDLVTKAAFNNGEETEVTATQDGKIKLTVTEAAQSGPITLMLANGATVTVEGFETLKPVAKFPENATPLDELDVVSTLGNRVKTVKFGDLEAEATAGGNGFLVTVPLAAETGDVTLVMDNGEIVAAGSIVINAYTFAAISEFAEESTTIGNLLECSVVNGESLTNVLLNGVETPYLLVGTVLYVAVGVNVGDNVITLVSDETNVDYTISVAAAGEVETILYNTPVDLTAWGTNYELNVDFSGAPEDAVVRIRYTKTNDAPQFKAFNGHWELKYDGSADGHAADVAAADYIDLPLSMFPYSDWGYSIILQGDGMIVSSISWVKDYSAPKAIWEGSFDNAGWVGNQDLAFGAFDWSTVKAGQTLYFTFTLNEGKDWACISLRHGEGWGNLPTPETAQFDFGPGDTSLAYTLTQADVDDLVANGGLVVTGDALTLTKIALK